VLLVDKDRFPRDKVCGDGISPPGLEALDRLGILREVMQKSPWKIDGVKIYSPDGQVVTSFFSHLKGPYPYGLVLPRREFDFLIFQYVQKFHNIQILENCEVKDLIHWNGRIGGIRAIWEHKKEEFYGKILVGADGIYSVVARKIFPREKPFRYGAFGVRAYFRGVKNLTSRIEIHCDRSMLPGYGWVFPTGEDSANVGVGISSRHLKKKDIRHLFQIFVEENPFVKERLKPARMLENSFQGCPIPLGTFFRRRSHQNVLLVGDAGGFADVLTGEGIYFALRSGECAAEAVLAALNMPGKHGKAGKIYESLWREVFQSKEYLIGAFVQRLIMKEFFLNWNIRRAIKKPAMARDLASILCHQKSKIGLLF
jgi:geranylgeranyl reductase family protein